LASIFAKIPHILRFKRRILLQVVVLVRFKPYLQDQLVSFRALTLLVWSYDL